MIVRPLSFLRKRSTDWEYAGLSLKITYGEAIYVLMCFKGGSVKPILVFIYVKLLEVLLLTYSASLMGAKLLDFFAIFSFFSHY